MLRHTPKTIHQVFVEHGGQVTDHLTDTFRSLSGAKSCCLDLPRKQGPYVAEYELVAIHEPESWTRTRVDGQKELFDED